MCWQTPARCTRRETHKHISFASPAEPIPAFPLGWVFALLNWVFACLAWSVDWTRQVRTVKRQEQLDSRVFPQLLYDLSLCARCVCHMCRGRRVQHHPPSPSPCPKMIPHQRQDHQQKSNPSSCTGCACAYVRVRMLLSDKNIMSKISCALPKQIKEAKDEVISIDPQPPSIQSDPTM